MKKKRCKQCREWFLARRHGDRTAKFCSRPCAHSSYKNGEDKRCEHCGETFHCPKHMTGQKFCSPDCRYNSKRGGKKRAPGGYVYINIGRDATGLRQYAFEHRIVMEKILGRPLKPFPKEAVHHRNQIRTDNRPENLELVLGGRHRGKVECPCCGFHFAIR